MINIIWLILLLAGVIMAVISAITAGSLEPLVQITDALFDSTTTAVDLAIGLIGLMALWLGMMKLAEESG
ncbi:MAG: hypothetical protein GWO41_13905, partial [candidate division Zixibacteria bacterium]|nr:hypothetical protein [candidate division Zixibacteria bacterium]NIW42212.1 hypothetical protein [candidate division Zixibacteria bacterium]NIX54967.1 hypothetical protein [candidate division Zixibacteria bacterium]